MPTDPNNDRYSVPVQFGEGPYDDFINNNFDNLARETPVAGLIADRPNASNEFAPQRYYATDKHVEYYNTGSSWQIISAYLYPSGTTGADIQAAIDTAKETGWNSRVVLNPAVTYTVTSEIYLKAGVTVDCYNARIEIHEDVNGFFCDHHTKLHNVNIRPTINTYTSDLVQLDTARAGKSYGIGGTNTPTHIDGLLHGGRTQATGLHCIADNGYGIGLGNRFRLKFDRCGQAIHMDAVDGWINTSPVYCDIVQCERGIKTNGGGGHVEYYGALQPGEGYSKNGIVNEANGTLVFRGVVWDAHRFTGSEPILQGSDITIYSPFCNIFAQQGFNSDGAPRQVVFDQNASQSEFMTIQDISNQEWYALDFQGGEFQFGNHNGPTMVTFSPDGDVRHPDANFFLPYKDIQNEQPNGTGETCIATANSSPNNEWSLCVSTDGSTWTVLDGTEVNPS